MFEEQNEKAEKKIGLVEVLVSFFGQMEWWWRLALNSPRLPFVCSLRGLSIVYFVVIAYYILLDLPIPYYVIKPDYVPVSRGPKNQVTAESKSQAF